MASAKCDNHDPKAKLDLRRYFLRKYHADGSARVLDCCQGGGLIWKALRKEFPVASYWGLDLKPQKGRLKLDSVRVLAQPGWNQNVIDVDTYGSPWKHWEAMLPNLPGPVTVFLTVGKPMISQGGGRSMTRFEFDATGLKFSRPIPMVFGMRIAEISIAYCLATSYNHCVIIEAVEAVSDGNARYVAVRLEKRPASASTPAGQHLQAVKEPANV